MALDDMCSPRIGIRKWTGWDKEKKITLRHVPMMWRRRYNNTALDNILYVPYMRGTRPFK